MLFIINIFCGISRKRLMYRNINNCRRNETFSILLANVNKFTFAICYRPSVCLSSVCL